jgi:predicted nucleotidyltransferase
MTDSLPGPPTGRFVVRLPPDLHRRLKQECARRGVSLNALCVSLLDTGVTPHAAALDTAAGPWVDKARGLFGAGLVGVVLFGSVARGEETEMSDIDLLIALAGNVPIRRSLYRRWDGNEPLDDRVNPHFAHLPAADTPPGSLWLEAALDGLILDDPQRHLARALAQLRRDTASGRYRLGTAHGQRYWIHALGEPAHAQ